MGEAPTAQLFAAKRLWSACGSPAGGGAATRTPKAPPSGSPPISGPGCLSGIAGRAVARPSPGEAVVTPYRLDLESAGAGGVEEVEIGGDADRRGSAGERLVWRGRLGGRLWRDRRAGRGGGGRSLGSGTRGDDGGRLPRGRGHIGRPGAGRTKDIDERTGRPDAQADDGHDADGPEELPNARPFGSRKTTERTRILVRGVFPAAAPAELRCHPMSPMSSSSHGSAERAAETPREAPPHGAWRLGSLTASPGLRSAAPIVYTGFGWNSPPRHDFRWLRPWTCPVISSSRR